MEITRRTRDVFYISANSSEQYYIYYGMEFHEFIRHVPIELDNILVTDGKYTTNHYNRNMLLETAMGKEEIVELSKEDIYGLGNFHWMDYASENSLDHCTPQEKAEILYLSHFGKPINSPFFDRLDNQFTYLAHDDGWFCKLYCKEMSVFKEIIANKMIAEFSTNKRRKIYPMDESIKSQLLELTNQGLLIDFSNIYRDNKEISLHYYVVGHYQNMDEMYHDLERNKQTAKTKGYIEHKNKKWTIHQQ
ncbi:hypothetical protein ACFP65_03775 [Marinilactibacillus sp. GCM10026970]|uniref:hypothetical protein n=1 Tax=Marinilactibacillus sp. GCM10026970 TaxID=3252642 RepID=UPI003622D2C5